MATSLPAITLRTTAVRQRDRLFSLNELHAAAAGEDLPCRELVIAYAAWISPTFHLKVIHALLATHAPPAEEDRDRVIDDLRLVAECTLREQPKLKRVLHFYNNPTLTQIERARLMGWKSTRSWYKALRLLGKLGIIDYRPNPTPQQKLALRAAKAQGGAQ